MNRETWLNDLAKLIAPRFEQLGYPLPKFHVAIGFPSTGKAGHVSGECWHSSTSEDKAFNIFIRPDAGDANAVARTLTHELAHAAVGFEHGHKGDFAKVMLALGFNRPLTSSQHGGQVFEEYVQPLLAQVGPIPHAPVTWPGSRGYRGGNDASEGGAASGDDADEGEGGEQAARVNSNAKKKQSTRMLKATCQAVAPADGSGDTEPGKPCGYTVRLSKKWAQKYGACCPVHGGMEVEGADDAPGDDDADA